MADITKLENVYKEMAEKIAKEWITLKGQNLDFFIYVNPNFKSANMAHTAGFIAKGQGVMLCVSEISSDYVSKVTQGLLEFTVAHELFHCTERQIADKDEFRYSSFTQVAKNFGLNQVIIKGSVEDSSEKNIFAGKLINSSSVISFEDIPHKCYDYAAMRLTGISRTELYDITKELCKFSLGNDMQVRSAAAKNMEYSDCHSFI